MRIALSLLFFASMAVSANSQTWATRPNQFSSGTFCGDIDVVTEKGVWAVGLEGDFSVFPVVQTPSNQFSRGSSAGNNWVTGNYPASPAGAYSSNIHARGVSHAYIAANDISWGPKVYETIDGGTTWTDINIGMTTPVRFVHFFSQNHGITVGEKDANNEFEIFTTQDGGVTWGRSNTAIIPNAFANEYLINDLYTTDGIDIWFATSSKRIFHSADRGLTWNTFWNPKTLIPSALAAQNGHLVIAFTTYNFDGLGNHKCSIYRTSNANTGSGWTNITPDNVNYATESIVYLPGTNKLVGAFRTNNSSGFVQMISDNEGADWTNFAESKDVFKVDFATSTLGWGGEYKTDNQSTNGYKFMMPAANHITPFDDAENTMELALNERIEVAAAEAMLVWPNPATDQINIQLTSSTKEASQLTIYNASGSMVRTQVLANLQQQVTLHVADLPSGIYTVRVFNDKQLMIQKFIKY